MSRPTDDHTSSRIFAQTAVKQLTVATLAVFIVFPVPAVGDIIPLSVTVNPEVCIGAGYGLYPGDIPEAGSLWAPHQRPPYIVSSITATGEIDTEALEIRNFDIDVTASLAGGIEVLSHPFEVVHSIIVDPPGFDPPYTVETFLGVASARISADYSAEVLFLNEPPTTLYIDPITLFAGDVGPLLIRTTTENGAMQLLVNGEEVNSITLPDLDPADTEVRLSIQCFQVPGPGCDLQMGVRLPSNFASASASPEDFFGGSIPEGGSLNFSGANGWVAVVPEPSTSVLLLAFGLVVLAAGRRRTTCAFSPGRDTAQRKGKISVR